MAWSDRRNSQADALRRGSKPEIRRKNDTKKKVVTKVGSLTTDFLQGPRGLPGQADLTPGGSGRSAPQAQAADTS